MQYGNFEKRIKDVVLNKRAYVLMKTEVASDVDCASLCVMESSCLAVNFGPSTGNKTDCELLNFAGTDYRPLLAEKRGFFHMRLEVRFTF